METFKLFHGVDRGFQKLMKTSVILIFETLNKMISVQGICTNAVKTQCTL